MQRVATIAIPHLLTILFLSVIEIANQEPAAYIRLANLSSLISAYSVVNETRLVTGSNWIREVQEVLQAGDQIVCQAEETIIDQDMNQVLLSTALSIAIKVPMIVVPSIYSDKQPQSRTHLSEIIL